MNPVPWLQMTNMISYQGLVRTFPKALVLTVAATTFCLMTS
ncbi:acid-resistance protein, partial [Klebsiella pneumoniae]